MGIAPASKSRTLMWFYSLFILLFFLFFTFHGLEAQFTFDDGTTVIAVLRFFETPFWRDLLNIVTVFTSAFRPLTTLFWKPLYAMFGFNPLPYRIVVHLLLMANLPLVYVWARRLDASREAAALATLVFCYNASMLDLFYDTCLVGDVMCFLFYGLAFVAFVRGRLIWTVVCFLLALDSKEQAVTLPAMLLLYVVMFRFGDLRDPSKALRLLWFPVAGLLADAAYLHVKVADMSRNPNYNPHVSVGFVLKNIAHNVEQLMYFPQESITPLLAFVILGSLVGVGALLRSRQTVFGVLFFIATLIPIAVIHPRGGYAAYIPYFGLSLALAAIVNGVREILFGRWETAGAVGLFVGVALLLGWAHLVQRAGGVAYLEWANPPLDAMLKGFQENIPDFPPGARVLLTGDNWEPEWGPMFLVRLMYHDNSIWVDRPKNMDHPPDPMAYDAVVAFTPPAVTVVPARLNRHISISWEMRGSVSGPGQFLVSSPHAQGAASQLKFTPNQVRKGERVTVSVPGLSDVAVNVLYRQKSAPHLIEGWCTLDSTGTCKITAPYEAGAMFVDWIQPVGRRWIFTSGVLKITE